MAILHKFTWDFVSVWGGNLYFATDCFCNSLLFGDIVLYVGDFIK